jgi:diacylglycerol kinase (ATP)
MKVCVLFNPRAGSAEKMGALREKLSGDAVVAFKELGPDDRLDRVAAEAAREGFDIVAVAGGDGSVHAVASGLIEARPAATLALLPLGTGNDFCRTLAIPLDPLAAADLLRTGTVRTIDVARVGACQTGYMVNAATGGFSGKVASAVTSDLKQWWGPLAYLRGAIGPITDPPQYHVSIRFDDGPAESFDLLNLVVANARTAAGGIPVAPQADPEDGRLDVVLVRSGDTLDLSVIAARLMHGDYQDDENVVHRLAARVEIDSEPPLPMSIDGELCEGPRFTFEIVPKSLRVLAGPDYQPVPPRDRPVDDEEEEEETPRSVPAPREIRKGLVTRAFGLVAGFLLLVKRTPAASITGLGLIAVAVLFFAWLANGVAGGSWAEANAAGQARVRAPASPALDRLALAVTWLGGTAGTTMVVVVLLAVFLGNRHYLTAATLVAVVAGVLAIEAILKPLFAIARPPHLGGIYPHEATHAFPSGHALRGVAIFGFVAALAAARGWRRRRAGWFAVAILCLLLAVGICWSRVYLGVHWPTDVIAGAAAASAWVAACLLARHFAMTKQRRSSANPRGNI